MATIKYYKTRFVPNGISKIDFEKYKAEIIKNPDYTIDPNPESFVSHFKGLLTTIKICAGIALLLLIIFGNKSEDEYPGIFNAIIGLSIFVAIFCGVYLLLEGPSYATYLKDKKQYYGRMTYAIRQSNSFDEFISIFFNK